VNKKVRGALWHLAYTTASGLFSFLYLVLWHTYYGAYPRVLLSTSYDPYERLAFGVDKGFEHLKLGGKSVMGRIAP
jgi:hypothetical protein